MPPAPDYAHRVLDVELDELISSLPAIAIEGAKGVGKTATASRRAATSYQLEDPIRRELAAADPSAILGSDPPVLIDEYQHVPELWGQVRRAVDAGAAPGQFLLTGSTSTLERGTHSGAARIVSLRMRPLSLAERLPGRATVSLAELLSGRQIPVRGQSEIGLADYVQEILRSGLPGIRHLRGRALRAQLDGYLQRIVDRDFPELGYELRNPAGLRRWMTAYAAASSTTATWEKIRNAATGGQQEKPAKTTVGPYRDVLERLWILDPVPGWKPTRSRMSRLTAPPKHQLADPALAARLLGATESSLLSGEELGPAIPRDGSLLGALFESLATLSIRTYAQAAEARVGHLRTYAGEHEVDLIVERGDGRVVAIEVKLARTIADRDVRHLNWLADQIGGELVDRVVLTAGDQAYRRRDGIAVVPAALLGP